MESVRSAFHAQLATVMDSLLAAAVCEIAKIFEGSLCEQQAELAQKAEEISRLRCRLEKVERRHEAKGGCTDEGEGSLRQQTPIGSVGAGTHLKHAGLWLLRTGDGHPWTGVKSRMTKVNVGKNPSHSEPEEIVCMLKEEVTGQEGASIKHERVRSRTVMVQATDRNVVSHTGHCSPKPDSSLLQAGEWLPGVNPTRGGSGLENLQPDGTDGSATASGSIGNDSSCFQRGFGSDETSNEGDDTSFAFLDQESENQNSEQGAGEKEAQADLTPATSGETAWRTRDDRGGINHTRRITQFATRDPLRLQSNSQLLAARQTNALSHPTASSGGNGRPYSCPYCTKCFTYPSHQRRHLLRHTGVRLHPCQFCDKSFLTPSELTVHTRTHTGERPFGCTQCGKRFARSGNLRAHQRDVHMGKRPFACVECGKRFAHRGNLRVHNHRVHQGDPYYTDGQPEPDINQNTV
ncbi:zinc finger protein with KRAB and SCAN domains 1-like isoform X2 [Girardinichthys multiradiatus]|uniref:zinc finger protein with KRAB and SCAN domains 1-like isoform X2 n=1 Tax=Girardinichthys multiradiatus TaxID=208333 RepID=UPI001FADF5D1|nr:zinc finger protein with KRAB and SCAN domains 1-like isoform X2 [Girardinichthys multiradiatus]